MRTEQAVDDLHRVREVPAAGEVQQRDQHAAESRPRPGAHHRGVVPRDRHAREAADRPHVDGHRVAWQRRHQSVQVGHLEVRRGCSLVVQARWVVQPLVWKTEDWACDDLHPPESAESYDVMSTRRESG